MSTSPIDVIAPPITGDRATGPDAPFLRGSGAVKFKAKDKEPMFDPERQKIFDRAFAKREAKLRSELRAQLLEEKGRMRAELEGTISREFEAKLAFRQNLIDEYRALYGDAPIRAALARLKGNQ